MVKQSVADAEAEAKSASDMDQSKFKKTIRRIKLSMCRFNRNLASSIR